MRLIHELVIKRNAAGQRDERGVPAQTASTVATVPGLIQPKSDREVAQLNQAGPVASTHTIFLMPTDLTEADFIESGGRTYQVDGIRDAAGVGHHLEVDVHAVAA
jgi:hypothetical protein